MDDLENSTFLEIATAANFLVNVAQSTVSEIVKKSLKLG